MADTGADTKGKTQAERLQASSRQRREHQKENLRHTILVAAGELFLEHGHEGLSMRQVAERIGYSATTIYRYYEDKDDLLFAIVHEGFSQFRHALMTAAEAATDPLLRVTTLCAAYIRFGLENPVYYQLMFMQRTDLLIERRPSQAQPMLDSFNILQQTVTTAMDAGVIKPGDVSSVSHALWALVHGITALAVAMPGRFTAEHVAQTTEVAMQMVVQGLRP